MIDRMSGGQKTHIISRKLNVLQAVANSGIISLSIASSEKHGLWLSPQKNEIKQNIQRSAFERRCGTSKLEKWRIGPWLVHRVRKVRDHCRLQLSHSAGCWLRRIFSASRFSYRRYKAFSFAEALPMIVNMRSPVSS